MDPFATLGMPRRYEMDAALLERRYRDLQRALHPDRHVGASASQRRMSLSKAAFVNDAYRTLKDDLKRAQALLAQLAGGAATQTPAAEPEFLMEVIELRERLQEAKEARDATRISGLADEVQRLYQQTERRLIEAFAAEALDSVSVALSRMQYYRRFLDEVSEIQAEAAG